MAVISSRIIDRTGLYAVGNENRRSVTYEITTDSKMNDEEVYVGALAAGPHPLIPLYTYIGTSCYVLSISLRYRTASNFRRWEAVLECGPLPPGETPDNGQSGSGLDNPLKREVEVWTERIAYQRVIEKDNAGNAILNTAGQPLDEPITIEDYHGVIVWARNFSEWYAALRINYDWGRTINFSELFGWIPPGLARFIGADTSQRMFENNTEFYRVEVRLEIHDSDGWQPQILQRGWKYYAADGVTLVDAVDDEGQLVQEPVLLDGIGEKLPTGDPGYFKTYDAYDTYDNYESFLDLNKTLDQIAPAP